MTGAARGLSARAFNLVNDTGWFLEPEAHRLAWGDVL